MTPARRQAVAVGVVAAVVVIIAAIILATPARTLTHARASAGTRTSTGAHTAAGSGGAGAGEAMSTQLERHALSAHWGDMDADDIAALVEDVKANGVRRGQPPPPG